jgi:chaperonin GroEL
MAADKVCGEMAKHSLPVTTKEEVENVATVSANGDTHIGGILSGIFDRLGPSGTITVQDGKALDTEVEYVEGIKWDRGYVSHYFVTDTKTSKAEFKNPLILLVDKKVSSI